MYNVIAPGRTVERSTSRIDVSLSGAPWGLFVELHTEEVPGKRAELIEWLRELADGIESGRMLP